MSKLNKGFTLFWFCYVLSSFIISSNAVDIIAVNHAIQDGDTIASAGDNFEMGFFSPGGSKNRYLGIWYKKLGGGTIVWVANRESPLATAGGVLRLSSNGSLQLFHGTDSRIWSSNSSTSVKNPVAQLLDTGNLVIREENDLDPRNYLWQSFDYPENTFLPEMKIGRDLVTGRDWSINSWKSNDDPSPGTYTIQFDMGGYPQLLLRQGSAVTFRVGPWNGIRFSGGSRFAEIPYLGPDTKFTYEFVLNEREIYFKYQLINSSVLVRLTMNPEGRTERFTWNDRTKGWQLYSTLQGDDCDLYAACGAYGSCDINKSPNACGCLKGFEPKYADAWAKADYSSGCVRKTQLNCTEEDKFVKYLDKKLPDTRKSWYNVSMNLEECKRMCLKNCTCTAYANMDIRGSGSGCFLWFGELIDMRDLDKNEQDVYVRMPASYSEADRSSRVKRLVLIIVCPVAIILTLLLIRRFWFVFKYRKEKREGTRFDVGHTGANENEREDLPMFEFRTIADATSNFSFNNKIGEGGFGPVYKGVLDGGQEIAVKRLSTSSSQGLEEFKNEVSCIAKLQHRNLVRLLGCCTEEGERMLIYEYMPNKSLDYFIFDNEQKKTLDWPKRYNIINGIARGLLYLHQDSRLRIIHRDLKASNILLDNEMNPRISDFGMARSFGGTETEGNTTRVVGTYGYMSPEYVIDGIFSIKSDVYSFGVLVLEILSGKRNKGFHHSDHNLNLLGHAWRLYNNWKFLDLIDGAIMESCNQSEAFRAIQIALLCVQQYPGDRPSMSLVVLMLTSKIELPEPKSPGFYTDRKLHETDVSKSSSSNQISVTLIVPR